MSKINSILIVEDEMIIAANIALQLTELGYQVSGIIPRGEDVMPHLQQNLPDLVLMDINLKSDLDGIDIAKLLQKVYAIPIIYLTANSDEANFNRAKETHPYAFIAKPFTKTELYRAIELTSIRLQEEQVPKKITPPNAFISSVLSDCVFVRNHDKIVKVNIADILYIEADRNYCQIHCKEKKHLLVTTLKDLEEKLVFKNLMRIHRSFMVNLSHIDEIATSHVVIAKKAIPLSAELRKQLLLHIQKV